MEPTGIVAIVSGIVSGCLIIWKIIRRFQKSSCRMTLEDGTKIDLDFNDFQKSIEKEINEFKGELTEEERQKLKQLASFVVNKQIEKVKSPKMEKPKKQTIDL